MRKDEFVYRDRDVLYMDRDNIIMKTNIMRTINMWHYTFSTLEKNIFMKISFDQILKWVRTASFERGYMYNPCFH